MRLTIHPISQHGKLMAGPKFTPLLEEGGPNANPGLSDSIMCPLQSPTKATEAAAETAEANCPNQKETWHPTAASQGVSVYSCQPRLRGSKRVLGALLPLHRETGRPVSRQQQSKQPQTQLLTDPVPTLVIYFLEQAT